LEQLAHALYVVRKATGSGQRAGRAAAVTFATTLNKALETFFKREVDYEWRRRGKGIGFKFFKRDPNVPFDAMKDGWQNFRVGIETKWISGHENEKAPQIRDNYYNKGFELIVIVGHKVDKWKSLILERGNFADYYLLLGKGDEKALEKMIQSRPLFKACGEREFEETDWSLVDFLKSKAFNSEVSYIRGYE
jgi:hypothetical protein